MPVRVQMGKLPNGDYGLRVVSSDGSTVIIDGTSDMFRISATGTLSEAITDPTDAAITSVTLTGLGALSSTPAHLSYLSVGNASTDSQILSPYIGEASDFVSSTSGGPVTTNREMATIIAYCYTKLDGSNLCVVTLRGSIAGAGNQTVYARYYILAQTAL